ncbi:hypothetical protein H4R34_001036 [Dimargaris verticillata]|uniref:Uncharacterized protein n=1 Tax=Dimargaris verticillata TaxID=2761393 RepID=A0A9W8EBA2_9FUNG|nr:hypothetical protein H4R34_001036 [Dimargaris verticillata]
MNSDKVIQAYLLSNNPANAPVMARQVEKGLIEHLEPYIIPYRARTVTFGSPYTADNMVLLSTLSDHELKQQLPLVYYTKYAPEVVPKLLQTIIAEFEQVAEKHYQTFQSNDDPSATYPFRNQDAIPVPTVLYWLVRDVLKAVIHYNQTSIAVEVKDLFEQVFAEWAKRVVAVYDDDMGLVNDGQLLLSQTEEYIVYYYETKSWAQNSDLQVRLRAEALSLAKKQNTMFWLWAIELGHTEMGKLFEPDVELLGEGEDLWTTIVCRLNLPRACAYLKATYGFKDNDQLILDYVGEPDVDTLEGMGADDVDQLLSTAMDIDDQVAWMPNPFFTWDRKYIQDAWVAKPVTRASVDIGPHVNALAQLSLNDRQA